MNSSRRQLLIRGAGGVLALPLLGGGAWPAHDARLAEIRMGRDPVVLTAAERLTVLGPGLRPIPAWLFADTPFPVLRARRGQTMTVVLNNRLPQHTAIHWHGVRTPNAMDGVPYLTQPPVQPGETFTYSFAPPDAGTYFFHPHCNTAEQLGRGMLGALIVEEDEPARFDDELVLILKDWRLDPDGGFLPFSTLSGASRAGSFGTLRTVNGRPSPRIASPAGGALRLRLINADCARICDLGLEGAAAEVIAVDGAPIGPLPLDTWRFAPGMRLDLRVRMPKAGEVRLVDYFAATPVTLATVTAGGEPAAVRESEPSGPPAAIPPIDLAGAWRHTLELGAGVAPASVPDIQPIVLADGRRIDLADSLCLGSNTFWAFDGQSWPEAAMGRLPPPLFTLASGRSVALELSNTTSRAHPIHLHGHAMTVLSASVLARPVHRADTVLVMPNERVQTAFVAGQPGAWMIHCHVVEHQETGMMAWFRVS